MKITKFFIDGALKDMNYPFELPWDAAVYAEYVAIMNSARVLGGPGFGSRCIITIVEKL